MHYTVFYYILYRSLGNVVGAIDWHSFGQLILRPYGMSESWYLHCYYTVVLYCYWPSFPCIGWTTTDIHDEARLMEIGDEMSARIKAVLTSHKRNININPFLWYVCIIDRFTIGVIRQIRSPMATLSLGLQLIGETTTIV